MKKFGVVFFVALLASGSLAWSQAEQPAQPFRAGVNLGTDVLLTGENPPNTALNPTSTTLWDQPESWTVLGFQPDVAFGKFGVGLDLTLHFKLYPTQDKAVELYPGDWVWNYHDNKTTFFDLYLPKIMYVRYGQKGVDPLFVKVGALGGLSLGNGFVMGGYSNMSFYPQVRFTGLDLGVDGSLFEFPYVGLELLVGNLARFDLLGAHVLGRPLMWLETPIIKDLQVGLTLVADTNPGSIVGGTPMKGVSVFGFDALLPIIANPAVSLSAFTETAFEPNSSAGFMVGIGGKLVSVVTYGLQLRLLGAGFIPTYFDANYDMYRDAKATYMLRTPSPGTGVAGWYASLGTSLFEDKISLTAALDGPFGKTKATADPLAQSDWPHLRAVFHIGEGLLPGIYTDATYEKYYLGNGAKGDFFGDLVDPTDAIIGLAINYKTGASVLTLLYNVKYIPGAVEPWKVTSSLQASLKF